MIPLPFHLDDAVSSTISKVFGAIGK